MGKKAKGIKSKKKYESVESHDRENPEEIWHLEDDYCYNNMWLARKSFG